jgi:hypothetical protein
VTAVADAGSVAARRRPVWQRRRAAWAAGLLLIGAGLLTLYIRQSRIAPVNSDGASNVLQAWDMVHGNLLLRGWWTSDVSFYTTELPEYMLVVFFRGLRPDVVHICGAITYTLTVLLGALLSRGRATGRAGLVRALVGGGIMLAPAIIGGTPVLLENPDHAGTAVPILAILLLLDRLPERWYVPVAVCLLLAWTQVADALTLVGATAPVGGVAVVRLGMLALRRRPIREFWFDASLAAAAAISILLASGAQTAIRALGGFNQRPLPSRLFATRAQIPVNARVLGKTLLLLFGANQTGSPQQDLRLLAWFHVIGLVLAGLGLLAAVALFFTRRADRVTQIVLAATLATAVAGIFGTLLPYLSYAHEVAILLPLGAVLAGRTLPGLLLPGLLLPGLLLPGQPPSGVAPAGWRLARRVLLPAVAVWVAASLAALCYAATWAPLTQNKNTKIADWLVGHGYTQGLAAYWQANGTTVDSGGRVLLAPVSSSGTAVRHWEAFADWYDPRTHHANFVVAAAPAAGPSTALKAGDVRRFFGRPSAEYRVGDYLVMVYRYNLLTKLGGRAFPGPGSKTSGG